LKKHILILFSILPLFSTAQQHPIAVEQASLLEFGRAQLSFGAAHFWQQSFPLSGLKGSLLKFGTIRFCIPLSNLVELQTDGTLLDVLQINERNAAFNSIRTTSKNPTADIGDFSLWTKFGILNEYTFPIGLSMRFGVQLPNASNESGLGVDEMNFFSSFLIQKHYLGSWTLNIGLGILGDPTQLSSQHDVCIYGFEYFVPVGDASYLFVQTAGRTGHDGIGFHRLANGKIGIVQSWGRFLLKTSGILNFAPSDNAKGIEATFSYLFDVFESNNSNDNH
jgi:hypothetical protein